MVDRTKFQNEELAPLWWDKAPVDMDNHPEYQALNQLLYDGTPLEIAENFKEQGNEAFKRGKKFYPDAIVYYSKAMEQKVEELDKASVYYTNRAAVNLLLENYGLCIHDCKKAIELHPANIKAYWRAARAYVKLGKYDECISYCDRGLEKELAAEKAQAITKREEERKKQEEKERLANERAEKTKELGFLLEQRDMVLGEPLFDVSAYPADIYPDLDNVLHFSVMFIYEEYHQTDFIQDFKETDTFADHFVEMFPDGNFLEWDQERKYKREDLEIYFEANCCKPVSKPRRFGSKEKKLIKVRPTTTLRKALQHEGYPSSFFV